MKKFVFIFLGLLVVVYLAGCTKKQQSLEEMQQPLSMEALSTLNTASQLAPESKVAESKVIEPKAQDISQGVPVTPAGLKPLPPSGPYRPTAVEIQTALKNSGDYNAVIDGKIGPMTRKAIEEFQKANGLQIDGKVGLKTWAVLSGYLNPAPSTQDVSVTKTSTKKR